MTKTKTPPNWLDSMGKRYWRKLVPLVELAPGEEDQFAALCEAWATYRRCVETLRREGLTYINSSNEPRQHPAVRTQTQALAEIRRLNKRFNLDMPSKTAKDELDDFFDT